MDELGGKVEQRNTFTNNTEAITHAVQKIHHCEEDSVSLGRNFTVISSQQDIGYTSLRAIYAPGAVYPKHV